MPEVVDTQQDLRMVLQVQLELVYCLFVQLIELVFSLVEYGV